MRRSELVALRVKDCRDGRFKVAEYIDGKNTNAVRAVPIHPDLADMVARLSTDKPADDYLLTIKAKDRGDRLGKLFADYKDACGVTDRRDGRRQDALDIHSIRKWTLTQMRAGFNQNVVADVCGHERDDNTTDQVYVGQTPWDVMARCVDSVRLPLPPSPALAIRSSR